MVSADKNVFNANCSFGCRTTLVLEGTTSVVAERGETFVLAVKANDFPDSNWTFGDTLSSPMSISVASSTIGIVDINDTTGEATVRSDAPYGSYQLTFNAVDAAGNEASPLVRELNVTDLNPPDLLVYNNNPIIWPFGMAWTSDALVLEANDRGWKFDQSNRCRCLHD